MDLQPFNPPDYGLIDGDPLTFKQRFQAFVDALTAHQSHAGDDELRTQLEEAQRLRQEAEQQAQLQREAAETLAERHRLAVAAYRQARLDGDASIPPELVQGESVEDVDAALAKARAVVEYIREKLQSEGGAGVPGQTVRAPLPPRVPAGAPGRSLPDVSAM